jgi:Fe-S cluster assembly protein SufB
VPKGVKVELPLQAYFRMNAKEGGQFEHTLIIVDEDADLHYIEGCSSPRYAKSSLHAGCVEIFVEKRAKVRYSSIENWSKNVYNLNTKRAIVKEKGIIEWVNGNMGSCKTMLYPCSVLIGKGAHSDNLGVAFAGFGQIQDTGSKVIHAAKNTTSLIRSKSLSKDGGIATYRGLVKIMPNACGVKSQVQCDALLLDEKSSSKAYPVMKILNNDCDVGHEATISKVDREQLFYLTSRGISEEQALKTIVSGFVEPIVQKLPLEYAVELNKLIEMEIEGF